MHTRKAGELLGRSGLQLPRVPSLNTDQVKSLTENLSGYFGKEATLYAGQTEGVTESITLTDPEDIAEFAA